MVDLEDGLRDLGPLVGIDGRTLKETPVLLLTDDGDMVRDASLLNPEVGNVVPLPASTGMTSSADQFFGSRSGPHQNQIHTDGATELARILLSLDVAARCATTFVGDCTSNFARFVVTYMTGVSLKTPWSFSPGAELLFRHEDGHCTQSALRAAVPHQPRGLQGVRRAAADLRAAAAESDAADFYG